MCEVGGRCLVNKKCDSAVKHGMGKEICTRVSETLKHQPQAYKCLVLVSSVSDHFPDGSEQAAFFWGASA